MVDIPTYERKNSINPVSHPSGFKGAAAGFIQTEEQISSINSQLSQNLANEEAQRQGIQAAQNPEFGKFTQLNPALSQSDKVFKETYRQESAQVLNFQGRKLLDNLYSIASQNPNPDAKTLAAFQKNAQEGIQKILMNSDPSTIPALKRSLEGSYISQNENLIKRVEDTSRKFRANQLEAQSAQTQKESLDASLNGNFQRAKELLQERFNQIDRQAIAENWPQELVTLTKRNAEVQNEANNESFRAKNAVNSGRSEEYLNNLRKNPPKDFSPSEQDQIINHVRQYTNQYEFSLKGQQYIEYTNAMAKLDSGQLTQSDVNSLRGKIGGEYFAKLSNRMSSMADRANEDNLKFIEMRKDYDSPQRMERWSQSDRDAAYERDVQIAEQALGIQSGQLPLNQRVNIASEMKAPNTPLTRQLSAGIRYGDVNSANAALKLNAVNEVALSGMDKKSRDILSLYEQDKLAHIPEDVALKNATGKIFNMDDKAMDENEDRFKELIQEKKMKNVDMQRAFVADVMNTGRVPIPAGFTTRFMDDFKQNYRRMDNWDAALKQTTDKFNRSYGLTAVNGINEFTQYPIEKYIQAGQSALEVIRKQGVSQIEELNTVLKSQYDSNNGDYYFEFPEKEVKKELPILVSLRPGSIDVEGSKKTEGIPIIRITKDYNGKVTKEKGTVFIQADKYSTTLVDSGVPSYFMGFKVEGKAIQPIIDPRQNWIGGSIRFSPNTQEYINEALSQEKIEKEKIVEKFEASKEKRKEIEQVTNELLIEGEA